MPCSLSGVYYFLKAQRGVKPVARPNNICIFPKHPDRSLFIFALLEPFLQPRRHSDHLIAVLRPGFGRVARGDAVVAFARGAHALPVACAWLIELHGRTVLQGDKRAGTWERTGSTHTV